MPYAEIYSHKQEQKSGVSGADQRVSMSQSPSKNIDKEITLTSAAGLVLAGKQGLGVLNQLKTSLVNLSGDSQLKRTLAYAEKGLFGIISAPLIIESVGLGVGGVMLAASIVSKTIEFATSEHILQTDQQYNIKVKGIKVNQGVYGGAYND